MGELRVGGDVKGAGRELEVGRVCRGAWGSGGFVEGPGRELEVGRVCRGAWEGSGG